MNVEQTGRITSFADAELFYRVIEPETDPIGTVLVVHGYGEHSGRHMRFMQRLASSGWRVMAFDLRGHGQSEGLRGFILRAGHCVRDIDTFVKKIRHDDPDTPLVLFGHSFGGALVMRYAGTYDSNIQGVVTSAMYLKNAEIVPPLQLAAARIIDFLLPAVPIRSLEAKYISRNQEVVSEYENDPLVYNGNIRVRTGLEILANYKIIRSVAANITVPAFLFHGTADKLSDPSTTPEVFALLGSEKKQLRMYDDLYHEALHEPEYEKVTADILSWLTETYS